MMLLDHARYAVETRDGVLVGTVRAHEECLVVHTEDDAFPTILLPGDVLRVGLIDA